MKVAIAALFIALIAPCFGDHEILARALYDLDNEGSEDPCTENDWASIYGTERRQLRGNRKLPSCSSLCPGWPPGWCRFLYPSCTRRQLEEQEQQRELNSFNQELTCATLIGELEAMHTAVPETSFSSAPCRAHIGNRTLECYKVKRQYSQGQTTITGFSLWKVEAEVNDQEVIVENLVHGSEFCLGDFDFSIEASAGGRVKKVKFELNGPDGYHYIHTDETAPTFTLFESDGNHEVTGTTYPPGEYDLLATPVDFPDMAQFLRFKILDPSDPAVVCPNR